MSGSKVPCSVCVAKPSSHCFIKLGETPNVYYCSIGRSIDLTNATAIIQHIMNEMEPNKEWILIFDCKGLSARHATCLDVIKGIIKLLLDEKYSFFLTRFIAINMSSVAQKLLDIVIPLLPPTASSGIDKCGSSPLEIMTCLQKSSVNPQIIKWVNASLIVDIGGLLPTVPL
jgi:hypothetical protein